jgi:hypothetical protein
VSQPVSDRLRDRAVELDRERAEAVEVLAAAPIRAATLREVAASMRTRAGFRPTEPAAALREYARELDHRAREADAAAARAGAASTVFEEQVAWLHQTALELDAETAAGILLTPPEDPDADVEPSLGDEAEALARAGA